MIDFGCLYHSISNKRSAFPTNETAFFVPQNIKYDYSRITESYYVDISNLTRTNRHTMSPQIWRRHSGKILASQSTPGLLESRFPTNADSDSILVWNLCTGTFIVQQFSISTVWSRTPPTSNSGSGWFRRAVPWVGPFRASGSRWESCIRISGDFGWVFSCKNYDFS